MRSRVSVLVFLMGGGCAVHSPDEPAPRMDPLLEVDTGTALLPPPDLPTVTDRALPTGFDDYSLGHFKRGRACIAEDFDLDGRVDFFIGSPGDESILLRNVDDPVLGQQFLFDQVLSDSSVAWGAAAGDYDNDGDPDIFISAGGNEQDDVDLLFKNLWVETGTLTFEDVTDFAGVSGRPAVGGVESVASAGASWVDYDNDGWLDLFVNVNSVPVIDIALGGDIGRNLLWHNNGDGTFTDVAADVGLTKRLSSRHSTWFDMDNDGDLDLLDSSFTMPNALYRNLLVEQGVAMFSDVTAAAGIGSTMMNTPHRAFASAPADINQDGWEDLIFFVRSGPDCSGVAPAFDPVIGHRIFLNHQGTGFIDITEYTNVNDA